MTHIVMTRPCFIDTCEYYKMVDGRKVWRSNDGMRFFTWDSLHGEFEVFNRRGRHLGSVDHLTGKLIKEAVKGRRINLS